VKSKLKYWKSKQNAGNLNKKSAKSKQFKQTKNHFIYFKSQAHYQQTAFRFGGACSN
jgi:hypothetical protein